MRNLNVAISEEAYEAAKDGAARSGMMLRFWVERLILSTKQTRSEVKTEPRPERVYEPMEGE